VQESTSAGLCLFGAPPDTGNLGVSALGESVVQGLRRSAPARPVTVFDNGWGVRHDERLGVHLIGARRSRRVHRPEAWARMRLDARLRPGANPGVAAMRSAAGILDISGGDSFTDLYGRHRFETVMAPKRLALRLGRPLVLLPQTYGPFADPARRRAAVGVLRGAAQVWSTTPSATASASTSPSRSNRPSHRRGWPSARAAGPTATSWWGSTCRGSSTTTRTPPAGSACAATTARSCTGWHGGCCAAAHASCWSRTSTRRAGRASPTSPPAVRCVTSSPPTFGAGEAKWLIARLAWFCGTRMHATIAALSSQVPVAALAYSGKTAGVFASCGQQDAVADARALGDADLLDALVGSFERREAIAAALARSVPGVVEASRRQFDAIVGALDATTSGSGRVP
jgi:colanic acid/amylovoran biosynthesis protein